MSPNEARPGVLCCGLRGAGPPSYYDLIAIDEHGLAGAHVLHVPCGGAGC
jgi:hypothetical protein